MTELADHSASACLSDGAVAAYVDGRVSPPERARIEAHLGSCGDCYLLVSEIVQTDDELADSGEVPPAPVLPFYRRRQRLLAASGLLAVAASAVLFVMSQRSPLAPLVSIVGAQRLTVARPTGGFEYGTLRSALRSSAGDDVERLRLRTEELRLRQEALGGSASETHAWGVAQLLTGDTAGSIRTLESAVSGAADVATHHADLGAARMTLFLEQGRSEDGTASLASLDRALGIDPKVEEALFNRALLLEKLGRNPDALVAWDNYLAADSSSRWAEEARRHRAALASSHR